jgi:hypothetical protein
MEFFAFRLARDLGMTRAELGRRITPAELTRWVAFYSYENKMEREAHRKAEQKARSRR